jgi:hypothetical protein
VCFVAAVGSVEQAARRLCSQVKVRFDDPAVASEAGAVGGGVGGGARHGHGRAAHPSSGASGCVMSLRLLPVRVQASEMPPPSTRRCDAADCRSADGEAPIRICWRRRQRGLSRELCRCSA